MYVLQASLAFNMGLATTHGCSVYLNIFYLTFSSSFFFVWCVDVFDVFDVFDMCLMCVWNV